MIWSTRPNIQDLQEKCEGTMCSHLGMEFLEVGDDFLTARMPVDQRTKQPAGLLHGGASVALAETLGSVASLFCLKSNQQMPVGLEINANHLKSAVSGWVTGKVTVCRLGRSVHVWNIEIRNDQNELVCVSRLTVMLVERKKIAFDQNDPSNS